MMDSRPKSAAFDGIPHFKLVRRRGTNDCRCLYECDEINPAGEHLLVELTYAGWLGSDTSRMWHKLGYTDHVLGDWWSLNAYAYDERGKCRGRYNPMEMTYLSGPDIEGYTSVSPVLDFAWVREATEENALALFAETYRRFLSGEPRKVVGEEYIKRT